MKEFWDIYDKNRVFQNRTIRRGDLLQEGEFYICCEVWFQNLKGELLITKRHPDKKAGGLWEFIGGGVLSGETTKKAAVREVKEEIGIDVSETELSFLHELRQKNYFMDIYLVNRDIRAENIVLNENETIDANWVSKDELKKMIENKEIVFSVAQRFNLLLNKLK